MFKDPNSNWTFRSVIENMPSIRMKVGVVRLILAFSLMRVFLPMIYIIYFGPETTVGIFEYGINLVQEIFLIVGWKELLVYLGVMIVYYYFTHHFKCGTKGPSGFRNNSETCYMNSMIQGIAASGKLIKQYEEIAKRCSPSENFKIKGLLDLLKDVNRGGNSISRIDSNSKKLTELMRTIEWNRTSQQDSIQLLSALINSIQKDLKNVLQNKRTMPPKFEIVHTFSEDRRFNKVQDHLALALPLSGDLEAKHGIEITHLLDAFFEPSFIDDGEKSTSMYLFGEAPQVLILHIQANEWRPELGQYIKPKYYINYSEILDYTFKIQRKIDESEVENVKVQYRLVAVVQHMGDVGGGHYVTYRMHGDQWYLTNDEQVEEKPFNYDVVPYIMVYEQEQRACVVDLYGN